MLNYDAWIPNLSLWVSNMGADFTSPPAQAAAIVELCTIIEQTCTGDNQQYESVASCVDILGKRDFGSWDEVWGDNVVCRFVHVGLTPMRPEVSYGLSSATVEINIFREDEDRSGLGY